jgi:electron transport complex protein RnfB
MRLLLPMLPLLFTLLAVAAAWPALAERLSGRRLGLAAALGVLGLLAFGLARGAGLGLGAALACAFAAPISAVARAWFARGALAPVDAPVELADRIEALLPQTQCTQCGYAGCKPYAQAIARGEAGIDQCPPGGEAGVRALAELLGRRPGPVDPAHGMHKPAQVALVREAECIGCTKCIQACPVDAIVGASKLMHTVIAELCTGCELCLPPCPVDCIDLVPAPTVVRPDILSRATG